MSDDDYLVSQEIEKELQKANLQKRQFDMKKQVLEKNLNAILKILAGTEYTPPLKKHYGSIEANILRLSPEYRQYHTNDLAEVKQAQEELENPLEFITDFVYQASLFTSRGELGDDTMSVQMGGASIGMGSLSSAMNRCHIVPPKPPPPPMPTTAELAMKQARDKHIAWDAMAAMGKGAQQAVIDNNNSSSGGTATPSGGVPSVVQTAQPNQQSAGPVHPGNMPPTPVYGASAGQQASNGSFNWGPPAPSNNNAPAPTTTHAQSNNNGSLNPGPSGAPNNQYAPAPSNAPAQSNNHWSFNAGQSGAPNSQNPSNPIGQTLVAPTPSVPHAQSTTHGSSNLSQATPYHQTPGGQAFPATPGRGSQGFPATPSGGQGFPATPGRGSQAFPATPGRGSQAFPATPGRGQGFPATPGGDQGFPATPGRGQAFPATPGGGQAVPATPGGGQAFPATPSGGQAFPTTGQQDQYANAGNSQHAHMASPPTAASQSNQNQASAGQGHSLSSTASQVAPMQYHKKPSFDSVKDYVANKEYLKRTIHEIDHSDDMEVSLDRYKSHPVDACLDYAARKIDPSLANFQGIISTKALKEWVRSSDVLKCILAELKKGGFDKNPHHQAMFTCNGELFVPMGALKPCRDSANKRKVYNEFTRRVNRDDWSVQDAQNNNFIWYN